MIWFIPGRPSRAYRVGRPISDSRDLSKAVFRRDNRPRAAGSPPRKPLFLRRTKGGFLARGASTDRGERDPARRMGILGLTRCRPPAPRRPGSALSRSNTEVVSLSANRPMPYRQRLCAGMEERSREARVSGGSRRHSGSRVDRGRRDCWLRIACAHAFDGVGRLNPSRGPFPPISPASCEVRRVS